MAMKRVVLLVSLAALVALCSAAPRPPRPPLPPNPPPRVVNNCSTCVRSLLVIGDSISDVGLPNGIWSFDNQTYPFSDFGYSDGRFTNGIVWVESLEANFDLDMVNYAVGGSTVNMVPGRIPLSVQLDSAKAYLASNPVTQPTLAVIAMGANDIVDLPTLPILSNASLLAAYTSNIVDGTIDAARQLLQAGGSQLSVTIVPTFIAVPYTPSLHAINATNPILASQLLNIIYNLNARLTNATRDLAAANNQSQVVYIDLTPELNRIFARPQKYVLKNVTSPCLEFNPPGTGLAEINGTMVPATLVSTCKRPNDYFFWDTLHPTFVAHRLIAKFAASILRNYRLLAGASSFRR